ncbi:MFS general substrate transporter [Rhizodiscina lignyota]|uniref:MFS general substrate transporter n=1 Tax=Rhizodiscina lignyota TaxID=1504668 RepID=A0A9P4M5Z8_9PEZI|nr:MFS general substrate transporter [Rhizodiscina lignyota]
MHSKHATGKNVKDVVLVPAPSSDPDDPLNWSPRRKALAITCMCVYTLMVGIASAAIYSVLVPISTATGLTLGDLNAGTGYMFLFFGWGCLVWQPLALQYGKRPVYLVSMLATLAIQVWAPFTKTNGQWIANKILQGFFGAPIESLCEITCCDLYFQHQRGAYIALYGLLLAGSNFFAPIIAGFIADGQGWQWVLYWCAIFCGIGFVFLFFFMEETNYTRSPIHGDTPTSASEQSSEAVGTEKQLDEKAIAPVDNPVAETGNTTLPPSRKTYIQKLYLFQSMDLNKPNQLKGMVMRPLIFLTFPVVFYAGFSYGSSLVWFNVLNGTASLILGETYGFPASMVGLTYISPLIGVAIAAFYTGIIGDRFTLKMARRNGGILESEFRLWLFAPSVILVPWALIQWGVGAAHHIHWFGCVFAMCLIAITNTVGIQLSVSYNIDSYRALAGDSLVTVIIVRNTMSFAIGYGITPWINNMGLQNAFITAAFVGMAQVLTVLIFIKCGKGIRERSIRRYEKYLQQMVEGGLAH